MSKSSVQDFFSLIDQANNLCYNFNSQFGSDSGYYQRQEFILQNKENASQIFKSLCSAIQASKIDDINFLNLVRSASKISNIFSFPVTSNFIPKIIEAILDPKCNISKFSHFLNALTVFGFNATDHFSDQKENITQCIFKRINALMARGSSLEAAKNIINILSNAKNLLLLDKSHKDFLQSTFNHVNETLIQNDSFGEKLDTIQIMSLMHSSAYCEAVCGVEIQPKLKELFAGLGNVKEAIISKAQRDVFESLTKYLEKGEEWNLTSSTSQTIHDLYGYSIEIEGNYASQINGDIVIKSPTGDLIAVIEVDGPSHFVNIDGKEVENGHTKARNQMIAAVSKYFYKTNVKDFTKSTDLEKYFNDLGLSELQKLIHQSITEEEIKPKSTTISQDSSVKDIATASTSTTASTAAPEYSGAPLKAEAPTSSTAAPGYSKTPSKKSGTTKKLHARNAEQQLTSINKQLHLMIEQDLEHVSDFLKNNLFTEFSDEISQEVIELYVKKFGNRALLLFSLHDDKCQDKNLYSKAAKAMKYKSLSQKDLFEKLMEAMNEEDPIAFLFLLKGIEEISFCNDSKPSKQPKQTDSPKSPEITKLNLTYEQGRRLLNSNCRNLEILEELLKVLSKKDFCRDNLLERILQNGIMECNIEMVDFVLDINKDLINASILISWGKDPNNNNLFIFSAFSPLSLACKSGNSPNHVAMVEYLIRKGADINGKRSADLSPLISACDAGNYRIVTALCNEGVDVNQRCLTLFAHQTLMKDFECLLVNRRYENFAYTVRLIKCAAEQWVEENDENSLPYVTALCAAIYGESNCIAGEYESIISFLITRGADVNQEIISLTAESDDVIKLKPLDIANSYNRKSAIEILTRSNATESAPPGRSIQIVGATAAYPPRSGATME